MISGFEKGLEQEVSVQEFDFFIIFSFLGGWFFFTK
jgi:hypothetical protein